MAQIYVSRAKIFLHGGKTLNVNPGTPVKVPDWVRETPTWETGVKDGSITDITPSSAPIAQPEADELTKAVPVEEGASAARAGKAAKAAAGLQK
jgi:hypothetical protein